jgi:hypothetical protein
MTAFSESVVEDAALAWLGKPWLQDLARAGDVPVGSKRSAEKSFQRTKSQELVQKMQQFGLAHSAAGR